MSAEQIKGNIQQIIKTFHHFTDLCENETWLKTTTIEDIKNAFKCAKFVEKAVEKSKENNSEKSLLQSLAIEGRTKVYENDFYVLACDKLLEKFFCNNVVAVGHIDVAIRMYSAMNSPERLEQAISNCLLKSLSYKAITNFILVNKASLDFDELECRVLFVSWVDEFRKGNLEQIKTSVDSMLDYYKVDRSFSVLVTILSFVTVDQVETNVQSLIIERIEVKVSERNILSKKYWLALLKVINFETVLVSCKNHAKFLTLVLDLVVYLLTMLELVEGFWLADETAICPEINYHDLIKTLQNLYNDPQTQTVIKQRILKAKDQIGLPIWFEVEKKIIK